MSDEPLAPEFSKIAQVSMNDLFDQQAANLEVVLRAKVRAVVRAFRPTGTPQSVRVAFERVKEMLGRDPVLREMAPAAPEELVRKLLRTWAS